MIKIKEENCINKNCNLKKYLKYLEKGESNDFILFQHCQYLYELAIKKFPDDYNLKINYIVYLVIQMSKKKLAERVSYTMKYELFHFELYKEMIPFEEKDIFITTLENNLQTFGQYYPSDIDTLISKPIQDYIAENPIQINEEYCKDLNGYDMKPIEFKNGNIYQGGWNKNYRMEGQGKYYIKGNNIFIIF